MRKALTILTALVAIFTLTAVSATARPSGGDGSSCKKSKAWSVSWSGRSFGDTNKIHANGKLLGPDDASKPQKYKLAWKTTSSKIIICKAQIYYGPDPSQYKIKSIKTGKYSGKNTFTSHYGGSFALVVYAKKK